MSQIPNKIFCKNCEEEICKSPSVESKYKKGGRNFYCCRECYWEGKKDKSIPEFFNCSHCGKENKLIAPHRSKYKKGQRNLYCDRKCFAESRFGTKRPDFSEILRGNKYNVGKTPGNSIHSVNENYFENIDSPEKAYWLGYIAADGCVNTNNGYRFGITSVDKWLVEKLIEDIDYSGITKEYNNKAGNLTYALYVNNKKFVNNLIDKGIVPRKTYFLEYPQFLEDKFFADYLRGYTDGDGCVSYWPNREKRGRLQYKVVGTESLISWFADTLNRIGITRSNNYYFQGNVACIQRTQNQAKNICGFIYNNPSRFLERKRNKFMQYLGDR